ncbi:MAG: hypothetical protein HC919_04665 [Oscillatoriales cyanobacterium SM2_2_1]|nr:hypothetical protein [Oscillatoriales cyanobacterium SM2_2_1]
MMTLFLEITLLLSPPTPLQRSKPAVFTQTRPLVYLPVTTQQSNRPQCIGFVARNASNRPVRRVYANATDSKGTPIRKLLFSSSLKPRETVAFELCQGESFRNVEAQQE